MLTTTEPNAPDRYLPAPPTDPELRSKLLNRFLDPLSPDLPAIAVELGMKVTQVVAWCAASDTLEVLENITRCFEARARLLVAQEIPKAIAALAYTVETWTPEDSSGSPAVKARWRETTRSAATRLITLYQSQFPKQNRERKRAPSSPSEAPAPTASPPTPPDPETTQPVPSASSIANTVEPPSPPPLREPPRPPSEPPRVAPSYSFPSADRSASERASTPYDPDMGLYLPDDILKEAGITAQSARIEFACRLYDADRLDLWPAAQLAGLSRVEFEQELAARGLPLVHFEAADFEQDLKTLEHLRPKPRAEGEGTS